MIKFKLNLLTHSNCLVLFKVSFVIAVIVVVAVAVAIVILQTNIIRAAN